MATGLYPPDFTTELGEVRLRIGDVEATLNESDPTASEGYDLSDETIELLLTKYSDKTSEERVYLTVVDCLRYLVGLYAKQVAFRERSGQHELQLSLQQQWEHYKALLDDYTTSATFNPYKGVGMKINTTDPLFTQGYFKDLGGY